MTMRLVPYAGTERQQRRLLLRKPSELLASIVESQKRGMLLSEIGAALGSQAMVRSAVLCWLFEAAA
jgi:hypothetical protein